MTGCTSCGSGSSQGPRPARGSPSDRPAASTTTRAVEKALWSAGPSDLPQPELLLPGHAAALHEEPAVPARLRVAPAEGVAAREKVEVAKREAYDAAAARRARIAAANGVDAAALAATPAKAARPPRAPGSTAKKGKAQSNELRSLLKAQRKAAKQQKMRMRRWRKAQKKKVK